ncbi:ABC transporter permease [Segnochrobactrum spirostomi]|uniref:ABC transporter permease n=1 Tax=Segnochrobactrum spirostomi TaxID=2608987 RepID=A0A6A7Y892_9HYPH|nr:ABC transporter permease [Segnochrobactrum spirostomi]MQT15513.1 ABC transporter permease [Segnochrobactrum spirostomi]
MSEGSTMAAAPPPAHRLSRLRLSWRRLSLRLGRIGLGGQIALALVLSVICSAVLILLAGKNPGLAFLAIVDGAFGSPHQIGTGLNRATPYLLAGIGVAICFRGGIINLGSEGQIAVGGAGAAAAALLTPALPAFLAIPLALAAGAAAGALWSGLAAAIHLKRRVHEVLATLLLNFVALLLVQQLLAGVLGQTGAGFLQSPLMPRNVWLPKLAGWDAHLGIVIAVAAAALSSFLLWRTPFGFGLRVSGASRLAGAYAGFSLPRLTWSAMLLAGALAGLAGGIEILGLHHRLIEGFSLGFGFKAVTVALIGAIEPVAIIPAALFIGFLETGSLAMQRQIGVPTALVTVIEGLTMIFVLVAMSGRRR